MADYQQLTHEFPPIFNKESRILILGTFPSVKSREQHFYYGHPQNRFWRVLATITGEKTPEDIAEKKWLLLQHGIAIWDVIQSCEIAGSSDSSIRNVVPSDIYQILEGTQIAAIFGNGNKACELYSKYALPLLRERCPGDWKGWESRCGIHRLPSTSPANAAWSLERLIACWGEEIKGVLDTAAF
ncbi:MAG: DNA-deoxyinosine glycosylase [Lachnospiraceae bacterium]|nr:DNA-deoxyinosine glycosylase [Lachnospiraceae bacterium]